MTITDYLINAVLVFLVLRQARERVLDVRGLLVPLALLAFAAHQYVHSIPTAGNDLILVSALLSLGLLLGVAGGFATHVRVGGDRAGYARVGWLAGFLLIAGISARMLFVFAVNNGLGHSVASFSVTNHLTAAAWPVALVAMAVVEVSARLLIVQVRAHRMGGSLAAASRPELLTAG